MTEKLTVFDASEHLKTERDFADFMSHALGTGDSAYIAHALGVIAKAKGMTHIANQTGLTRAALSLIQCKRKSNAADNACSAERSRGRAVGENDRADKPISIAVLKLRIEEFGRL